METINIKGKDYVPVNERIKEFWKLYPNGRIDTDMLSNNDGVCVFKCSAYKDADNRCPDATGYAYEKESSSFINKTRYIENCETSAIGRALGILGIGIDVSVASADEVDTAMENQKKIDATKVQALKKAIENRAIPETTVKEILGKYYYKTISDILVVDYKKICDEFSNLVPLIPLI